MKMRKLPLVFAVMLSSCMWIRRPHPTPLEDDRSIVFPRFSERTAVAVGAGNELYELDGVTLRAALIAVTDFLPPVAKNPSCWDRQEAYRYRVIRQGDIIFVRIYPDLAYCGREFLMLDGGVTYAISTDGRILRRLFEGEPEGPVSPEPPDAGVRGVPMAPGTAPSLETHPNEPSNVLPPQWLDAGSSPPG
jgi:hypothetical protein